MPLIVKLKKGPGEYVEKIFLKARKSIDGNIITMSTTTLGTDVTPHDIYVNPDTKIRLNFWEVGSEFQGMGKDYCIDAKLAIIFKDDTNNHLEYEDWIPQELPRVYVENYHITYNRNILDRICGEISSESDIRILCLKTTRERGDSLVENTSTNKDPCSFRRIARAMSS